MSDPSPVAAGLFAAQQWHLFVALGIGLLVGLERERRKGAGPEREAAGVRTFALVGLLGGLAAELGGGVVLAVCGAFVAGAAIVAYATRRNEDPGLTTQVALMTTFLLGALTWRNPALAAGLAVVVTALLAARGPLHRFVRDSLSPRELHDGLVFAAAALVVLPLVPDHEVGPYGVLNPFVIWRLVVIVMAISAGGYVAMRLFGSRLGLAVAGFAGGFVSSTITVAAMGARARDAPLVLRTAVAGATLAGLASLIELGIVVEATYPAALRHVVVPLVLAGAAAAAYAAVFSVRALRVDRPGRVDGGACLRPSDGGAVLGLGDRHHAGLGGSARAPGDAGAGGRRRRGRPGGHPSGCHFGRGARGCGQAGSGRCGGADHRRDLGQRAHQVRVGDCQRPPAICGSGDPGTGAGDRRRVAGRLGAVGVVTGIASGRPADPGPPYAASVRKAARRR